LAKAYAESDQIEIVFIARGETQKSSSFRKIITDEMKSTPPILFLMIL
jgi:2-dehydropantoate 2-reductase